MSGLEQKAKTLAELEIEAQQLLDKGFLYKEVYDTPVFFTKQEIDELKDLLKNYNDQALAYEKSVEERLGQIRKHTKNFPDFEKCRIEDCPKEHCMACSNREYIGFCYFMESLAKWLEELVGLLEATKVGKRIQN